MFDWLPVAIAVVLFLGSAVVYLRGARDKGTIETLTRNNDALDARVKILEAEAVLTKADGVVKDEKIKALEDRNVVLQNTVNSSELIMALQRDLGAHHTAAMTAVGRIHEDLDGLPNRLAEVLRGGGS